MAKGTRTGTETAKVTRIRAKQDDLPGVDQSDRKIQELEDLGDELSDLHDQMDILKGKVKEADVNLVAAMKRRERTYYNRPTWGSITIKETKTSAKVKKHIVSTVEDAEEGGSDE